MQSCEIAPALCSPRHSAHCLSLVPTWCAHRFSKQASHLHEQLAAETKKLSAADDAAKGLKDELKSLQEEHARLQRRLQVSCAALLAYVTRVSIATAATAKGLEDKVGSLQEERAWLQRRLQVSCTVVLLLCCYKAESCVQLPLPKI